MTTIFHQSITRLRAKTRTSRAGVTEIDWSQPADRETITDVSVQPNFQREDHDNIADARATGYRVLSRPGTTPDIDALDRIEYRNQIFEVHGEVAYWPDPHGDDHIEFTMRGFKGA